MKTGVVQGETEYLEKAVILPFLLGIHVMITETSPFHVSGMEKG